MRQATLERQQRVLIQVLDKKHVTVKDLATNMAVSEATVRRDLKTLADSQKVALIHGGAMLPKETDFSFFAKRDRNTSAKMMIGQLAALMVTDGDQIFLDSGTTCFEMARCLSGKRSLSVIVNSARVALELQAPSMKVIMLGGQYRPERMDTVGPITMATLEQLRGFVAFIGADGLSMDFGPAAVDMESAHLYRLAVANARETVLLVDHTKFQAPSLFKIVDWEKISCLVTDEEPSLEWREFFERRNIKAYYPSMLSK